MEVAEYQNTIVFSLVGDKVVPAPPRLRPKSFFPPAHPHPHPRVYSEIITWKDFF
jgi:hypothetical protein